MSTIMSEIKWFQNRRKMNHGEELKPLQPGPDRCFGGSPKGTQI
jgi:hypothetical protein